MNNEANNVNGKCQCGCHKGKGLKGIVVILIGVTFLLSATGVLTPYVANIIWPILLIIFGIKMLSKMCKCCPDAGR